MTTAEPSHGQRRRPSFNYLPSSIEKLDQVLEGAILKRWDPSDFRLQRARLGELASQYVRAARTTANEGDADLPSIWSWASDLNEGTSRPERPAGDGPLTS